MPIKIHSLIMIKKAKLRFTTESDYNIMKESVIYKRYERWNQFQNQTPFPNEIWPIILLNNLNMWLTIKGP